MGGDVFFFVGEIIRDSLAVYFFSDYYSSKPFVFLDSDGQVEIAPASLIDFRTAHTVPTPSSDHHLIFFFFLYCKENPSLLNSFYFPPQFILLEV